jgi:hypothetical protein
LNAAKNGPATEERTTPCTNVVDITGESATWEQTHTDSLDGKTITIEGYPDLPFLMMLENGRASVHLTPRMNQGSGGMVTLLVEEGTCENMMQPLPSDYSQDDMIFMDNAGEEIVYGQSMRITGKAEIKDGKYNIVVEKIEKTTASFDYEKESARLTNTSAEKLDGQLVYAEGVLSTPDEQGGMRMEMFLEDESLPFIVNCNIRYGALNNQANELEENYSDEDIVIRDRGGKKVLPGSKVRVYGVWKNEKSDLWVEEIVLIEE